MACKPRILLESNESDPSDEYIGPDLFNQLKDALLCPVCYDVFKNPV